MQRKRLFPLILFMLMAAIAILGAQPALAQETAGEPVGIYVATVPAADDMEAQVTIYLMNDGAAVVTTATEDGAEPGVEFGAWELADDDTLMLTIIGSQEEEYPEPIAVELAIDEDTLTATGEAFGPDGVTFYLIQDEQELAAFADDVAQAGIGGVYATDAMPQAEGPTVVALVYLMEDGSAQLVANYFGALMLPLVETGAWTANPDGTVTLTLSEKVTIGADGPALTALDKPAQSTYQVGPDGELMAEGELTFYPVAAVAPEVTGADEKVVFIQVVPATAESPEFLYQVVLAANGGGGLASGPRGEEPQIQLGYWEGDGDTIVLTLLGTEAERYEEPIEFVFTLDGDQLIATVWDAERYGEEPLVLLRLEVALQQLDEIQAALGADASETEEPPVHHLSLMRPATQDADAAYLTAVEDSATGDKPQAFVFQSETMSGADDEEFQMTIVAFEDGTFAWFTDALDGEEPAVEYGSWTSTEEGAADALLLGTEDEEYVEPIPLKFQKADDGQSLLVINPDLFGEDGLIMYPVAMAK